MYILFFGKQFFIFYLFPKQVMRVDWFCTECKLCTHCNKTNHEHKLLICDCCDRAYHLSCLDNKMTEVIDMIKK